MLYQNKAFHDLNYTKYRFDCFSKTEYNSSFHKAQKTIDEKKGNCANRSLASLALIYKIKGLKYDLLYGWQDDGNGNAGFHYQTSYESMNGFILYEKILFDNIAEYIYYRQ